MEDSLKLAQDSPDSMDIEPVEASAQQQVSALPKKAHEPNENGKSSVPGSADDMKVDDGGAKKLPESNINNKDTDVLKPNEAAKPLSSIPCNMKVQAGDVLTKKPKTGQDDVEVAEADDAGTGEEQTAFMVVLESFYKERALDFKPPKFYGEPLNCLKLWRAVTKLGGYELVTASKLWRQVGESFHPPKTCTTVSWTFRIFYEKALLEFEKHKVKSGELDLPLSPFQQPTSVEKEANTYQTPVSGRARRDAAARAMQGWHAQRYVGYGEVAKDYKSHNSSMKREKNLKSIGVQKQKTPSSKLEHAEKATLPLADKQLDAIIADVGPPADWVKVNVWESKDGFEVYALVPGLLREEVRVQSDPAGRLVITGKPEQPDNPWGVTPFQKVVTFPRRIDPLQTSATVSLHGCLFVRVPLEQA